MSNFIRKGKARAYFVPSIVAKAAPTAAEITAGTELSLKTAELNDFTYENQPVDVPNLGERFTPKIPGEDTVGNSNIVFYEDDTTNPLRTALAKGVVGYIVIFFAGTAGATPAAADKCEVWPVVSTGPVRMYSVGNEAAKWRSAFTASATPATDAVVA